MTAVLHHSFATIAAADWDRCLPDEAESYAYYRAVTGQHDADQHPVAVTVSQGDTIIAVAPIIALSYRLDTSLQGPLRRITDWISHYWPGLLRLDLIGLGSALAEHCHLGFDTSLTSEDKRRAFALILDALATYAKAQGIGLLILKDINEADRAMLAPVLDHYGMATVNSLPIAVLDVPASSEAYLASLSPSTRKDIRRKLKIAAKVSISIVDDIAPIASEIASLYEETRSQSRYDYDEMEALPDGYFLSVSQALKDKAQFALYHADDHLIGFNLLLVERNRLIDKFIGMRYPLGPDHNLYAISWMTNLDYCIKYGLGLLQTGQTAYAAKLRMGSRLVPSFIFFRHSNKIVNALLRGLAPFLAFDKQDPDLQKRIILEDR